jgi:glutathione S-transferase
MALKIWGRANSSNVAKVMWAVAELNIPYERIDVGGPFGGTHESSYRALNPMGQIPTLDDNGFILWESNAIVRYLADNYGGGQLWPQDRHARADADRWMDWASLSVAPAIDALRRALRLPETDEQRTLAVEKASEDAVAVWQTLEPRLVHSEYIIGDALSVADVSLGALVHRWHLARPSSPQLPWISSWYELLCERAHYARHIVAKVS